MFRPDTNHNRTQQHSHLSTRSSASHQPRNHPHQPFWQLTRTMVWVLPGRKLGPWSEFPFLYSFTVLLNSGGSNSPWSELWSEFPCPRGVCWAVVRIFFVIFVHFRALQGQKRPTLKDTLPERGVNMQAFATCSAHHASHVEGPMQTTILGGLAVFNTNLKFPF